MTEAGAHDPSPKVLHRSTHDSPRSHYDHTPSESVTQRALPTEASLIQDAVNLAVDETFDFPPWECLFRLARAIRSIPGLWYDAPMDYEDTIVDWHSRAATQNVFETDMEEFCRAWERVKFAEGEGIHGFLTTGLGRPMPVELARFSEPVQWTGILCRELQVWYGAKTPFYLSTRVCAAVVLGKACKEGDHVPASRWLGYLERKGLLETVSKGSAKSKKASTFLWKGSLPQ